MATRNNLRGLLLIVTLAFLGFLLIAVPSFLVNQFKDIQDPTWATVYGITVGAGFLLVLVSFLWILLRLWLATRRKRRRRDLSGKSPQELSPAERERQIDANLQTVEDLKSDTAVSPELRRELDPLIDEIVEKRESRRLEIVAFGTVSSGKSSLLNALAGRDLFRTDARGGTTTARNEIPWPGMDRVILVDTPGLGEVDRPAHHADAADIARDADMVLLVVDGPLRDCEHQLLSLLSQMGKKVLICLNKEDWYNEQERASLISQINKQASDVLDDPRDVIAVRSRPTQRTRVRLQPDQTELEETVPVDPDIAALARRMMQIVKHDGRELLAANLLVRSRGLVEEARHRVRESLDSRAWQVVDRYTWGAGGAAALSPFPLVDLVAGCAISTKMVLDLARIYRQEIDTDVAVKLLGELGKNLLAILGTSAALPAVTAAVASLLKTVPGAGTIAGGALQGIVVALVTRWIGAVFIEYFRNEMQTPEGGLTGLARRQWERITSVAELRRLINIARNRLSDKEDTEETQDEG
jgi:small GTP-binding protein